ncbi:myc box-dependent-interacting protein 1-like [Diadema antillarum]|uniref:myc box-dependent-interacting protein 1-like n=1 Tax=Diadema antillarum TaxID=105358 RepID=UPI003A87BB68
MGSTYGDRVRARTAAIWSSHRQCKMAEIKQTRKSSIFQKNLTRTKEKVLQKLGKADETRDELFEHYVQNFTNQQAAANKLYKELKNYVTCVRAMSQASRALYEAMESTYESEWQGQEQLANIRETLDLLWDDYQRKLVDQIMNPLMSYQAKFPEVKKRMEKRGRKLIDYDSARHNLEASKKKDDQKYTKAQEAYNEARKMYEELNSDLHEELPTLYDSRIPFYANTFQLLSAAESTFYEEVGKAKSSVSSIMGVLYQDATEGKYDIRKRIPELLRQSNSSSSTPPSTISSPISPAQQKTPNESPLYSVPAPIDQRRNLPEDRDDDDDDDDEDQTAEYQVPRSTPLESNQSPPGETKTHNGTPLPSSPPPLPQTNGSLPAGVLYRVRATHDYSPRDSDELTLNKGDIVCVVEFEDPEDQDEGWLMGHKENSSETGVFPENFTCKL